MKPIKRGKGFRRATDLVAGSVRRASEARGFSETRLLTHWADIAGAEIAQMARPVSVQYTRGNFGATLTLLTTGAHAPLLKMQEMKIRERVNACYGYNAIGRIRITQTAPVGFAEGKAAFTPQPVKAPRPDPARLRKALAPATSVSDPGLKAALERLGANIISKSSST